MIEHPVPSSRRATTSSIEALENRIAPASIVLSSSDTHLVILDGVSAPSLHVSVDDNIGVKTTDVAKTVVHGGEIVYTISYFNNGSTAANVTLTEQPDNRTFYNGDEGWNSSANGWTKDVGAVQPDGVVHTVTFSVRLRNTLTSDVTKVTDTVDIGLTDSAAPSGTTASIDTLIYQGIYLTAPGVARPGHYADPHIRIFDIALQHANSEGSEVSFNAYTGGLRDSIRTAVGDFNADGFDDVILLTEHGKGAVRLFDGETGAPLTLGDTPHPLEGLRPFGAKGGFVAAGDLTGRNFDGGEGYVHQTSPDDVVFGSSLGGGAVKIYNGVSGQQLGPTLYPFGKGFTGGVRVAIGDVDKDGYNDIIVGQGNFGNQVKVYRYDHDGGFDVLGSFQVGGASYKGGVNLSVGNLDGFGGDEIVVGHNRLSAPTVEIWQFQREAALTASGQFVKATSFNAFEKSYTQGVRVALADVNLDGAVDVITAAGWQGKSQVKIFDGLSVLPEKFLASALTKNSVFAARSGFMSVTPEVIRSFTAYPERLEAGVWVSGSVPVPEFGFLT